MKVALFRCQWVWLEEINTDSEGFTTVDLTKTAYRDDPFVLARDVMQVFYARDNKTKGRLKVVLVGKKKIVDVDGVTEKKTTGLLGNASIRGERTPTYPSRG